ncbi:hypothetical protein BCON_0102g00170 [Botryotinia convoluta]|uniref:Uncharacterized protein n=1 Tax=Botryotinia convoluta TaxID=54673 RepID=A0A4Z1I7F8_9HELO|nr:hypothetical protein BCON_0102g00170 [Botryotinia convoluta]
MDMEITQKPESAVAKTPAESEEETLISVIMHSAWPIQYQSRIPYDFNYYGNFYFASMAHRGERLKAIHKTRIGAACVKSAKQVTRLLRIRGMIFLIL